MGFRESTQSTRRRHRLRSMWARSWRVPWRLRLDLSASGEISDEAAALLRDTEDALDLAVEAATSGNRLGAIGHAVQSHARSAGRGVVRDYGGHGIGRQMHEDPHVPNIGTPDRGVVMRSGLTLAIEPMLTLGGEETRTLADGWTVVTADGSLAAHFEHTVASHRRAAAC